MRIVRNAAIVVVAITLFAANASAQTLEALFVTGDAGLRLLRDGGATYAGPLSLERVPSGAYVIELGIAFGDDVARYPIKARREAGAWALEWQPAGVYAGALLAMLEGAELPSTVGTPSRWAEVSRFPGLPIIATKERIVTPFGELDPADKVDGESQGDLEVSGTLQRHVNAWINRILEGDEAPAGFDLILARDVSWKLANKLLFNAAVMGLHEISVVTAGLGVVQLSAPISAAPVAVAMYRVPAGFGFRVVRGGEVEPGDGCAPEMTFCADDPAEFTFDPVERPMFAATGELTIGEVLPFLGVLVAHQPPDGAPPIMGYLQQ